MPYIQYPECGQIINTHGCRGGVKIDPWCDSPAVLAALQTVYRKQNGEMVAYRVQRAAVSGRFVVAELSGVETMEAADALRGTVLYASRDDLGIPEGVLLVAELIGLPVTDARTGVRLGTVKDVIHPAHTDIYVINTEKGEAMVPVVPEFVQSADLERGVYLTPIEGMFD